MDRYGYQDVDLAPPSNAGSHFFIEGSSFWSLVTTVSLMGIFLAMHSYAAMRAPVPTEVSRDFYKINASDENTTLDVDLTLSSLKDYHRSVAINASLVAVKPDLERVVRVQVSSRRTALNNFAVVGGVQTDKKVVDVTFTKGQSDSTPFLADVADVAGIDTIQIRMTVQADFAGVAGFRFDWAYANPGAAKYVRSAKLLMSFLVAYMFIVFVFYLKFDAEVFTQVVLIVLGVAGIFASNPVGLVLGSADSVRIADSVLLAIFVAWYRFFLLVEFELLRSHRFQPGRAPLAVAAFVATSGMAVDSYIGWADVVGGASSAGAFAWAGKGIDLAFLGVGLIWCLLAFTGNAGQNARRVGFFAFSQVLVTVVTLVTRVFPSMVSESVGPMLFGSVHVTLAAIALFLMHSGGGPEYAPVEDVAKEEGGGLVLDANELSSDESDGGGSG